MKISKKMCFVSLALAAAGVTSSVASAGVRERGLSHFQQRFQITTNDAGEKIIVDKDLDNSNGLDLYVENMSTFLRPSAVEFTGVYMDATCKGIEYEDANQDLSDAVNNVISWMQKTNVGDLLVKPEFLKFLKKVQAVGDKFTMDKDYKVMANLDNPTYFFDKAFFKYFKGKLIDLAKGYVDSAEYMKVVNFIVDDYGNQVGRKKMYHQNMLIYYLETYSADALGLTETERTRALSSIDDSRLSFSLGSILDSKKIAKDFTGYGVKQLANTDKGSEQRWTDNAKIFDSRTGRIDAFFSSAVYEKSPLLINLAISKDWIFDKRPSLAFDPACPNFLYENRRRYEFARVGLSLFPIPFSSKLDKILSVHYTSQAQSEGMLAAAMEATDDASLQYIIKQSVNPLLQ